jgi:hypothetical protein
MAVYSKQSFLCANKQLFKTNTIGPTNFDAPDFADFSTQILISYTDPCHLEQISGGWKMPSKVDNVAIGNPTWEKMHIDNLAHPIIVLRNNWEDLYINKTLRCRIVPIKLILAHNLAHLRVIEKGNKILLRKCSTKNKVCNWKEQSFSALFDKYYIYTFRNKDVHFQILPVSCKLPEHWN